MKQISQRSHSQLRERKTSAEEEERLQRGGSQLTKVIVVINHDDHQDHADHHDDRDDHR